jgi:hydrogenase/urease accessory protein HupE
MVLTLLAGWSMTTGDGPRAPVELMLLAAVLGPTLVLAGRSGGRILPAFAVLSAVGVTPGLLRIPLPAASLLVLGSLIVLGGSLAFNRPLPGGWAVTVAALAVIASSWSTALALSENVSRATAVTIGVVLVAVFIFYAGIEMARGLRPGDLSLPVRFLGAVVAVLAVVWRLAEYRAWFDREVATEAAFGLARLPLLALGLAVLALILWPRQRRVVRELGLQREARSWHWALLGAALLVVPYGTIAVPNPFFEPHAPRGEDARRVVTRVLNDTYHAFNIGDEEDLYDTLAANVTGNLVDDLYLDGRRRLTAGTRDGTEVTVRDVGVLEIGEPFGGANAEEGFSYDCRWAVTARVQHLQHIHHRQNIYNGVLTLRSDGGRWKISGVELLSEDRTVVQWKPTS